MTAEEQLEVYNKAKQYAKKRMEGMPDTYKATFVRDAIYCAYLEGAGIRTKLE